MYCPVLKLAVVMLLLQEDAFLLLAQKPVAVYCWSDQKQGYCAYLMLSFSCGSEAVQYFSSLLIHEPDQSRTELMIVVEDLWDHRLFTYQNCSTLLFHSSLSMISPNYLMLVFYLMCAVKIGSQYDMFWMLLRMSGRSLFGMLLV